jgi:excisionase family DNA binding protein
VTDRLLTLGEVAKNLGCTVSCLRRWRAEGKLTIVKLSRLVRVPEAEYARIAREGIAPEGKLPGKRHKGAR